MRRASARAGHPFNGKTTTYSYDLLSRLLSRSYPADTTENVTFTYTADGLRATALDARGTTSYAYDNRRRLTSVTTPSEGQLTYAYDPRGLRTSMTAVITSQSYTTLTTYDADGRISAVQDPLGGSYSVAYDAAGNRTQLAYPNTTSTAYSYDVNNRLTNLATVQSVGESGAPVTVQSFAYTLDAEGKRTQLVENTGTVRQYGYDGIDRLTSETVTGSLAYAKTFTYDPVGNRESQVTTGSGAATTPYTYDTRDRMLTSDGSTYTYDANGNALTKSGEAYYTVNEENRLSQVQLTNGSTIQHTYDADGNRVKTVEPSAPAAPTACSGNSASFVRKDTTTQGNWIGTYGADGDYINALTAQPPSYGTVTFTGTSNFTWASSTTDVQALEDQPPGTSRIASTWYSGGTETFSVVTTDGNEHTIALYLLDWDGGRAETVTAETPTGTVLSSAEAFSNFTGGQYAVYTICGSVNFVVTLTAGANAVVSGVFFGGAPGAATTTSSLVDTGGGLSQVVGETNASNALTALYVRAGDELLSVIRPNGTGWTQHFIHKDGLGSVRTITDDNGNIVDTRGYEAFGTKNAEAGSEPLTYGFAGEAFDSTTHLAYHRARWMDSRVGRFTGMDAVPSDLNDPRNLQRYSYVTNDPADRIDPTGNDDVAEQMNFFNFVGIQIPSGKCAVSSFDVKFTPLMSHPSIWNLYRPTLAIAADFTLMLSPPSSSGDCLIQQFVQGSSSQSGTIEGRDAPPGSGRNYIWDTVSWDLVDNGDWNDTTATWEDRPGFGWALIAPTFPLSKDATFATQVVDWVTSRPVVTLNWEIHVQADTPDGSWSASGFKTGLVWQ